MADKSILGRSLLRRAENTELSLVSLEAIAEIRERLNQLEAGAMKSAREKGATMQDIAAALRLTPQAIYYRLRNNGFNPTRRGRPRATESREILGGDTL
jgi:hypothetical protein